MNAFRECRRRADRLDPNGRVVATLRAGNRAVTANLNHPLVVADNRAEPDNRAPVVRDMSPRDNLIGQPLSCNRAAAGTHSHGL